MPLTKVTRLRRSFMVICIYIGRYGGKQYRTTDLQCGEQQIKETKFAVASVIQVLKK